MLCIGQLSMKYGPLAIMPRSISLAPRVRFKARWWMRANQPSLRDYLWSGEQLLAIIVKQEQDEWIDEQCCADGRGRTLRLSVGRFKVRLHIALDLRFLKLKLLADYLCSVLLNQEPTKMPRLFTWLGNRFPSANLFVIEEFSLILFIMILLIIINSIFICISKQHLHVFFIKMQFWPFVCKFYLMENK
jgi:hypothetical protein